MAGRREQLLDAAIALLGDHGVRAVTHRAVDAEAGLPMGSASNHFRTRDALFDGIVERFAVRERSKWEGLATRSSPTSRQELAGALSQFALEATREHRALTLARYSILIEAARRPSLRQQLGATGAWVNDWFAMSLRAAGSTDVERDASLITNYWTGLVLHELAAPDPAFDPCSRLTTLLDALIPASNHREALSNSLSH